MKIGFIVAMESEYLPFLSKLGKEVIVETLSGTQFVTYDTDGRSVVLAKCGIGEIASASATALLIGHYNCNYIVNFGLVGSLDNIDIRAIVAVKDVVHYDFDLTPFGRPLGMPADVDSVFLQADQTVLNGALSILPAVRLASGDKFVSDSERKNKLVADFGANICDMEGAGIALVCTRAHIPFSMIKLVSDGADEGAVETYTANKSLAFEAAVDLVLSLIKQ